MGILLKQVYELDTGSVIRFSSGWVGKKMKRILVIEGDGKFGHRQCELGICGVGVPVSSP